jgi:hypothetical protein
MDDNGDIFYDYDLVSDIYKNISWEYQIKAEQQFDKSFKLKRKNAKDNACWLEIRYSFISIIFAVLSIEGYINRFAKDRLDPMIWKEFDRLSLDKKFIIFPKLVFNRNLDSSSVFFKSFRQLIDLRNMLIHYKCKLPQKEIEHPCGTNVPYIWKYANCISSTFATKIAIILIIIIDSEFDQKSINEITEDVHLHMNKLYELLERKSWRDYNSKKKSKKYA